MTDKQKDAIEHLEMMAQEIYELSEDEQRTCVTILNYIAELEAEMHRLTDAGLNAAYTATDKTDECEDWIRTCEQKDVQIAQLNAILANTREQRDAAYQERGELKAQLAQAQQWQPIEENGSIRDGLVEIILKSDRMLVFFANDVPIIVYLDNDVRLCKRVQP